LSLGAFSDDAEIMTMRFTLLSLVCALLIAGCNSGEDFADAELFTPILKPSPGGGGPLPEGTEFLEIEFVDDPVVNLGYECQGDAGLFYIPAPGNGLGEEDNQVFDLPSVARCGLDATAVSFFIGATEDSESRVELGRMFMPQQLKNPRYQVSTADIIQSPARLPVPDDVDAPTTTADERRAFFMAALLQVLDQDSYQGFIDIPDAAHQAVLDHANLLPEPLWDYDTYGDFQTAWDPWLAEVDAESGTSVNPWPSENQVRQTLQPGTDRSTAGTYTFVFAPYSYEFIDTGEGTLTAPLVLELPVLVYPDGVSRGVGFIGNLNAENGSTQLGASNIVAVEQTAVLEEERTLDSDDGAFWTISNVFEENSTEVIDMELSGRFLGVGLYYALDGPPATSPDESDYDVDYPQSGIYEVQPGEGGRYAGDAFGENYSEELLQGSKRGSAAVYYDQATADLLGPGSSVFYQMTPYSACFESPPSCDPIPLDERGVTYPTTVTVGGEQYDLTHEKLRPGTDDNPDGEDGGAVQNTFYLEIRDDGYILTDLDKDCAATTGDHDSGYSDGDNPEYRVGFITRASEVTDTPASMNITLHMAGPAELHDVLPHYGLRTIARINLSDSDKPLYRTADDNFADELRATWIDAPELLGYAFNRYERENGEPSTDSARFDQFSLIRGAMSGQLASSGDGCPSP
jgi:hypothetical protein